MFKFNKEAARLSEAQGGRIEESGSYSVTIKQAYVTKSAAADKKSEALTVEIVTDSGDEGKIFLWYQKADGSPNDFAIAGVNALMGCLKMRELEKSKGQIDAYDYELKEMIKKDAEVFADMVGKKLKMAIQAKWDTYNGKSRIQLEMKCPATLEGFTVSEVLDGTTKPAMYQRAVDKLKPVGPKPEQESGSYIPDHPAHKPTMPAAVDFDDDSDLIPF